MSAISTTIRELVKSYLEEGITAAQINHGYCADLASVVWEQTGARITNNEEVDGGEYKHTFIIDGEKFYDSEFPDGESDFSVFMARFCA
jgi:hypothetical protein